MPPRSLSGMHRSSRCFKTLVGSLVVTLAAMGSSNHDDRLPERDSSQLLVVTGVDDPKLRPWFERISAESVESGEITRISGVLEQSHRVSSPPGVRPRWIEEWFVRQSDGTTVAVAIPETSDEVDSVRPSGGARVACDALEIGRLAVTGRDGIAREWPLFVARPVIQVGSEAGAGGVAGIVAATLMAGAGWLFLRRRAAVRSGRGPRLNLARSERETDEPSVLSPSDLPKDPADAMAVLANLTEEESSDETSPSAGSQS